MDLDITVYKPGGPEVTQTTAANQAAAVSEAMTLATYGGTHHYAFMITNTKE